MLISFIIPTLNEATVLERTLKALRQLRNVAYEIIISDGKSTDATLEIAKKYQAQVVEYTGLARQTIGQGKNMGAAVAEGEYLIFLDADVVIFEINDFIAKALKVFAEKNNVLGLTVFLKVLPEQANILDKIIFGIINGMYYLANNFLNIGIASGEFQMVRAASFKKLGGYNELLAAAEDQDFFARINKIGRTYVEPSLSVWHTSRRAHKLGWPRLLATWIFNFISLKFFKRSLSKEWKVIR
ncbi:MAG: glycosyltransferase [Patescibacteria group bacterium]|jgi:glycosyltransferase involved in cell wall biosynthesis